MDIRKDFTILSKTDFQLLGLDIDVSMKIKDSLLERFVELTGVIGFILQMIFLGIDLYLFDDLI